MRSIAHCARTIFLVPTISSFLIGPIVKSDEIVSLLIVTVVILFLPKVLGILLCLMDHQRRSAFGGATRLLASAIVETLFSILIAPGMMLLHAYFVLTILGGHTVAWNPQTRDSRRLGIHETARYLLAPTLIGAVWGALTFFLAPQFFWWLTPVLSGLGLAIPLVTWSSRISVGRLFRRLGLLFTPEELRPPTELGVAREAAEALASATPAISCSSSSLPPPTPPEVHGVMRPQWIETAWPWRGSWGAYAPQSER
jgi:membrane glycosyltransferase